MATSNIAARAQRVAQTAKYAPRKRPVPVSAPAIPPGLRKLLAKTLDELKVPGAIPSQVILSALTQAQAMK